jgi:nitroreductase
MLKREWEPLLAAAGTAPSGDNTQPWRFTVNEAEGTIALEVDPTRDPSPMNVGQRMARIALGAALENLVRAAQSRGWTADVEIGPRPALATVHLSGGGFDASYEDRLLLARVTNRRAYDGRALSSETLEQLALVSPELDGIRTHWIATRERIDTLGRLIGRGDALMFGEPSMRSAFLSKVRFDAPANEVVEEGLSLSSLELSAADRFALRAMTRTPNWLLRLGGAARVFAAKATALVRSASGLCLVVAPGSSNETDLAVGRAMQRAWLALTALGLHAQPMMSLCVLESIREYGDLRLHRAVGLERLNAVLDEFRAVAPEIGAGRPAYLFRFGHAPAPSGRTGRMTSRLVSQRTGLPIASTSMNV